MSWIVAKHRILTKPKAQLKWLVPAFKNLNEVIVKFIKSEDEPLFWYNERALDSMLIAAAARSDYVALADYSSPKRKGRKQSKGYCDLYLSKNNRWLKAEAKLQWSHTNTNAKSIEKVLNKARSEAERLRERRLHCAGLLFAVMSLSKEEAKTCDPKTFKLFERKFREVDSDFCWIWYDFKFPSYSWYYKKTYTDEDGKDERFYPGLAIFLKLARP